jgi:hypothetical protein
MSVNLGLAAMERHATIGVVPIGPTFAVLPALTR